MTFATITYDSTSDGFELRVGDRTYELADDDLQDLEWEIEEARAARLLRAVGQ